MGERRYVGQKVHLKEGVLHFDAPVSEMGYKGDSSRECVQ